MTSHDISYGGGWVWRVGELVDSWQVSWWVGLEGVGWSGWLVGELVGTLRGWVGWDDWLVGGLVGWDGQLVGW